MARRLLVIPGAIAAAVAAPLLVEPVREVPQTIIWVAAHVATYLAGAVVVLRRRGGRAGRRLLGLGTALLSVTAVGLVATDGGRAPGWAEIALIQGLELAVPATLLALLAVYPDGEYRRRSTQSVVRAVTALPVLVPVLLLIGQPRLPQPVALTWLDQSGYRAPSSPLYVPVLEPLGAVVAAVQPFAFHAIVFAAVGLFALRYRREDAAGRVAFAWPMFAVVLLALTGAVDQLLWVAGAEATVVGWASGASLIALPVLIAIGMVRPELWDVRRLMRNSAVYGVLWLTIGLAYVGLTAAAGLVAAREHAGLAIAVTIVVTLLLQPGRRLLQRRARRWVYGARLSQDELLRRFGRLLEHALEPDELPPAVAAAVHEGLDVAWVRIRLDGRVAAAYGLDPGDERPPATAAPLGTLGAIECGPRAHGRLGASDRELLAALGRQTGLALHNARLAGELQERVRQIGDQADALAASRARLVAAEAAARREIERDIHDGVQQELVALIARIRLARNQLGRDPTLVDETLTELQGEAGQALENLRELARGIHPSVLTDRGLVDAIEGRAARLPLGVTIECDPALRDERFPEPVEGAAYFLVCEGFTNALKHSRAERVTVRLHRRDGRLDVDVSDDGAGFDPGRTELGGLRGLEDRVDALGGTLRVVTAPGEGTRLQARLPAGETAIA